jgi:hypothetical protein
MDYRKSAPRLAANNITQRLYVKSMISKGEESLPDLIGAAVMIKSRKAVDNCKLVHFCSKIACSYVKAS